jgi:UDP-N-acetylmuramoyl-tripeptide--D-alanyl-D-alanine ligase
MSIACRGLENVQPPQGRGDQQLVKGVHIIDDSYNANPASVKYALTNLSKAHHSQVLTAGRKIAILGDILELGDLSQTLHAELVDSCNGIDKVIAVGPAMAQMYKLLPKAQRWFAVDNADDIDLQQLVASLKGGDEVLIKGSNKMFWLKNFVQRMKLALQEAS